MRKCQTQSHDCQILLALQCDIRSVHKTCELFIQIPLNWSRIVISVYRINMRNFGRIRSLRAVIGKTKQQIGDCMRMGFGELGMVLRSGLGSRYCDFILGSLKVHFIFLREIRFFYILLSLCTFRVASKQRLRMNV